MADLRKPVEVAAEKAVKRAATGAAERDDTAAFVEVKDDAVVALKRGASVTAVPRGEERDKAAVTGHGDSTYNLGQDGNDVTPDGELGPGRAPLDDAVAHVDVPGSRDPTVGPGSGRVTLNGTAVPDDVPGPDQARSNDAVIHLDIPGSESSADDLG